MARKLGFQKRHYEWLASRLKAARSRNPGNRAYALAIAELEADMIPDLRSDNPLFNADRFRDAAALNGKE